MLLELGHQTLIHKCLNEYLLTSMHRVHILEQTIKNDHPFVDDIWIRHVVVRHEDGVGASAAQQDVIIIAQMGLIQLVSVHLVQRAWKEDFTRLSWLEGSFTAPRQVNDILVAHIVGKAASIAHH